MTKPLTEPTEPTGPTRAYLRAKAGNIAQLESATAGLSPDKRAAAVEAGCVRTIRYERYRRNGVTRIRKAREAIERASVREGRV